MTTKIPQPKANHKVKKNETIEGIAKKYGFKNVDDIWKYPKNKSLVKLRKKPAQIQVGDVVVIPAYNDKERKEIKEKRPALRRAAGVAKFSAAKLNEHAALDLKMAGRLDEMAVKHKDATNKLIAEYKKAATQGKRWSDGVDFANAVFGIVNGLRILAQKSLSVTAGLASACKEEVKAAGKLLNDMVSDVKSAHLAPVTSEIMQKTGKYLSDTSTGPKSDVLLFGGQLIESYGKLTSPSFYGQGLALLWEGKSYEKAATFNLEQDCKDAVKKLTTERDRIAKLATEKAKSARARAKKAQGDAKKLLAQAKTLSAEADAL
ncbi:LysM peptidoglycan-binding domain-containing protein [Tateyamaria sp.]|uniref:LysM peptidoglycan-binding domain-containing protein n=1 Tax=Tateyamaria sp. TaxID=1929288 RepID=UPI00329B64E1